MVLDTEDEVGGDGDAYSDDEEYCDSGGSEGTDSSRCQCLHVACSRAAVGYAAEAHPLTV